MANELIDCKGLSCPMPIVKLSRAMKNLAAGQTVTVEATDPAFEADLQAWAKQMGHAILEFTGGTVQKAVIEKK